MKTAALGTATAFQLVLDGATAVGSGTTDPGPTAGSRASDLPWTTSVNGWGPAERDRGNGEQGAADGHALTLDGTTYARGIGVHADSDTAVRTGGHCSSFTAAVGVGDEISGYGDVVLSLVADGVTLRTSPILPWQTPPLAVDVRSAAPGRSA